ncbi:SMRP1 protein, partial [Pelecanoides urinatrix]|nr:SMRP1 protein [Pelecanoides urinatrix]
MFFVSKKHKTPISTYTDSYRPPCSVKKTIDELPPQPLWRGNQFVTQGLTMPPVQNLASQSQTEQLNKKAMQEYYRNTIDPTAYQPSKYWLARSEEKYNPIFVHEDKYTTWRTGSYNSAAWNKHSCYLPLLPKETKMETLLHSIPMAYSPKCTCLKCGNYPRPVPVMDWLLLLSLTFTIPPLAGRLLVADVLPVYTMTGSGLFHGYYSPCSGRHYCLRGMDYYVDGDSAIRRHLNALGERAVRSIPCCSSSLRAMSCTSTERTQPSSLYRSPRWDTSHFSKVGGVQRSSYTIHPDFSSEAYSAPWG